MFAACQYSTYNTEGNVQFGDILLFTKYLEKLPVIGQDPTKQLATLDKPEERIKSLLIELNEDIIIYILNHFTFILTLNHKYRYFIYNRTHIKQPNAYLIE